MSTPHTTISDELRARVFLLRATEPPAPAVDAFVAVHGPIEAVARIRAGAAPPGVLAEILRPDPSLDADLDAIESGATSLLTPEAPDWPTGLLGDMHGRSLGAPLGLWVRGTARLGELTTATVTIIGSRAATAYGEHVATDFAHDLARARVTILSSGSYGIDGSAHRGALAADGATIAVLSHGIDVTYPSGNSNLFARILDAGGLVVSEYPPGTTPTRDRAVARGRLLAALGAATVVVERGARSNTNVVVRTARALGRRVYGVPGPITSTQSVGVIELLRTGQATAVSDVTQINYQHGIQ